MANVKISQLPGASAALGTQEFEVNESGLSKKVTGSQLSTYVRGQVVLGDLSITATASEINKLDGVTASTAELNLLDGVTASTSELNLLDGVTIALADITATATELNYVSGVTSSIQTQLDAKYVAATQDTATWEAGTGTTESLVSPAKVKAAIEALTPASPGIGDNETWQSFGTFNVNTAYQNTYGKPIQLAVTARTGNTQSGNNSSVATFQASADNSTYFSVASVSSIFLTENTTVSQTMTLTPIIPTGHWFKLTTSGLASTVGITVLR